MRSRNDSSPWKKSWVGAVPLHQLGGARIEESKPASRDQPGHVSEQPLIEHLGLREIGDFRRSADIRGSWKDVVLNDWPEESVRRQLLGSLGELRRGIAKFTNRNSLAVFQQKEQRRPRSTCTCVWYPAASSSRSRCSSRLFRSSPIETARRSIGAASFRWWDEEDRGRGNRRA